MLGKGRERVGVAVPPSLESHTRVEANVIKDAWIHKGERQILEINGKRE